MSNLIGKPYPSKRKCRQALQWQCEFADTLAVQTCGAANQKLLEVRFEVVLRVEWHKPLVSLKALGEVT